MINGLACQPDDSTLRPVAHGKVEKTPEVRRGPVAHHVVVLVSMNDEAWTPNSARCDHPPPSRVSLVMVLDDEINRPSCPGEKPVQLAPWMLEQREVVQVYVQDDRHRLIGWTETERELRLTLRFRRARKPERSGGCRASPASVC